MPRTDQIITVVASYEIQRGGLRISDVNRVATSRGCEGRVLHTQPHSPETDNHITYNRNRSRMHPYAPADKS